MRIPVMIAALSMTSAALAQSSVKTRDYSFDYSYPAAVAAVPALRTWLEADRARLRASTARDAAASRVESRKGGFPFHAYESTREWKTVTNTPRFLSLSARSYSFTGGAHGNPSSGSLVWDKAQRQRLDPRAVFVSPAALQAALSPGWCAWVKAERTRRVGADTGGDTFAKCPKIAELTVLLGSSTGRAIDRIGLIADPYVAGSFAEGFYETTLPVTPQVLRVVKTAYRVAFTAR